MSSLKLDRASVGWRLWLGWVLVSITGFAVAFSITGGHFPEGFEGYPFSGNPIGALQGLVIGILQWLVLRRQLPRASWWILASVLGFALAHVLGDTAPPPLGLPMTGGMFGAVAGALVGVPQWLVLRRRVPRAGWWVLASVGGWYAALSLFHGVGLSQSKGVLIALGGSFLHHAGLGAMVGGVSAAITGIALVGLLRQSAAKTAAKAPSS